MITSRSSHALHRSCEEERERRKKGWLCIQMRVAQGVSVNTAFDVWPERKTVWRALKKNDWLGLKDKVFNSISTSSLDVQLLTLRLSLWYSNISISKSAMRLAVFFWKCDRCELRSYLVRTSVKLSDHVFLIVRKKQAVLIWRTHT